MWDRCIYSIKNTIALCVRAELRSGMRLAYAHTPTSRIKHAEHIGRLRSGGGGNGTFAMHITKKCDFVIREVMAGIPQKMTTAVALN